MRTPATWIVALSFVALGSLTRAQDAAAPIPIEVDVEIEFVVEPEGLTDKANSDKPNADKPAKDTKSATKGLGERRDDKVTLGEQLSFRQQQVHAEMNELESRMFRLSEALKKLEPENSSRLIIGLKYARDELILHQMQDVQKELASLSLQGATEEQKQLLAKLDRLEQLLLSTDLDFEMRLQRLKMIRQTLRELDNVIREESRQEKASTKTAEAEKQLEKLAKRQATLEELVRRQTDHLETNAPLAKVSEPGETEQAALKQLAAAQEETRASTRSLGQELEGGATSKSLFGAEEQMAAAVKSLEKPSAAEAQPEMQAALDNLKQELADVDAEVAKAKQSLQQEKFAAMRQEQERTRGANDKVAEMTRQLGSSGTAALQEILRASGSMSGAESSFGKNEAQSGNGEQDKALASLNYAKELLAEEAERLARQLRAEVKKRVMDGLTQMLEEQTKIRERTQSVSGPVEEKSRQALAELTALSQREEKLTAMAEDLITIVEETEFGIALPAALAAVRDATENVQFSLADGDAGPEVVEAEKRIEADLKAMLEVVGEMSDANSRRGRRNNGNNSPEDERKELNRIISELKMIRLLEVRVHENTGTVDKQRTKGTMTAALRKQVEHLEGRQSDIQEATELLAEERGDELPQGDQP